MKNFRRCFGALLGTLLVLFLSMPSYAQEAFRFRADQEKIRIVLDVPVGTRYQDKTVDKNKITLEISGNKGSMPTNQSINDALVRQISLMNKGKSQALTVDLKQQGTYKVFALSSPERIVLDIFRTASVDNLKLPEGVEYKTWVDYSSGQPVKVYLLKVEQSKAYRIVPMLAQGRIWGKAVTQQILTDSIGGVNASYFDANGSIYGNTKINGLIVSAEEKRRTGLAIDNKLGYKILQAVYKGNILLPYGKRLDITGVNRKALYTDLIVYNDQYDETTRTDNSGVEVVIKDNKVQQVVHNTGNTPIPKGGYVLAAFGYHIYDVANLNVGETMILEESLGEADAYDTFVGAGPCLVQSGKVLVTAEQEDFPSDIRVGRAPRTAIGITAGNEILLLVADGRSSQSAGFTLEQLAECMLRVGAKDAMNFDGGGSSTLVTNGYVMNRPSDGSQRPVAIALAIRKAK